MSESRRLKNDRIKRELRARLMYPTVADALRANVRETDVLARWEGLLASCLREAQQRRELSETHDAEALASVIVEGWEGAVMRGKVLRDGAPLQRFVSMVLPRLLE